MDGWMDGYLEQALWGFLRAANPRFDLDIIGSECTGNARTTPAHLRAHEHGDERGRVVRGRYKRSHLGEVNE